MDAAENRRGLKFMNRILLKINVATLSLVILLAVVAVPPVYPGDGLLGMSLPADFRSFSSESPWNVAIPPNPDLDSNSALMMATLAGEETHLKADLTQWTIPLFVIDADQSPLHTVVSSRPFHPSVDPEGDGRVENIPLPDGVWPDPQKDGHLLLVDPVRRQSWDLSRAVRLADGSWRATRLAIWDLNGPGFVPADFGKRWWLQGARGTGMPLLAGLVRPEEVESGQIRHALACATPVNRRARYEDGPLELCSPPAARNDGRLDGARYIPAGARIQLDPDLDLDSLSLSPASRVVARAMQVYGMFNADVAGSFKIYFQNLGPTGGRWQAIGDFSDLANIPIERFRILQCQTVSQNR